MIRSCPLLVVFIASLAFAQSPRAGTGTARVVASHGYDKAVELTLGPARAVLCPEIGGRVLEFSIGGKQAMWFDEAERTRQPGGPPPSSAGRFDFGPEMTTPRHPKIWAGAWTAEITGPSAARLTSQKDESSGVQLTRDFELTAAKAPSPDRAPPVRLVCKQTITNISAQPREYCHWGRSFSPGGGICLIPLAGVSRFPSKFALYEDGGLINVRATDEQIRERDGFLEILAPPRKPKLGFDSYAGWLAYVMPGDLLFVKRFATYPDRVYNEAAGLTISVWYPQVTSREAAKIELEPIGPRERLAPGASASFTEEWFLLSHPFPKPGESIDLARVRAQVKELPE
jgi:hypothetical protein